MAIYDYQCDKHGVFEVTHSIKIKLEHCPKCEEEGDATHPVERLISLNGKGVVELTGNELKEKVLSDAKAYKAELSRNENTHANFVGESRFNSIQSSMDRRRRR